MIRHISEQVSTKMDRRDSGLFIPYKGTSMAPCLHRLLCGAATKIQATRH